MNEINIVIEYLKNESSIPITEFDHLDDFNIFRGLCNIRPAKPINQDFLQLQNRVLKEIILKKGIISVENLKPLQDRIYLWKGDITTLKVDAIVNAANSGMTGCYCPLHACIDNAIHTFAGVQLRIECNEIMKKQKAAEIAVKTVKAFQNNSNGNLKVICNVFKTMDKEIYRKLLS